MRQKKKTTSLSGDEFTRLVTDAGMTANGLARMLGLEERTPQRYKSGETPVPVSVALPLMLIKSRPELKDLICAICSDLRKEGI